MAGPQGDDSGAAPRLPDGAVPLNPPGILSDHGSEGLEAQTVRGIGWMAGSQATNQLLQFLLALAFTRLLAPSDFGLVGMAAVFVGVATLVADSGFGAALIQRETVEERHLNAVFWAQLLLGLLMGGALVGAAPAVGAFYGEPRAIPIVMVTAANFLISAVGPVQYALLSRRMQFRTLFRIDLIAFLLSAPLALAAAVLGAGPWSLVIKGLASNVFRSIGLLAAVRWRPRGRPDRAALVELTRFSGNLLASRLLNFATRNGDNALIGRYLGAGSLGIYLRGYGMLLLPSRNITRVVGNVMLSSLARMQADPVRVKRAYLKALSVIALIAMPAMAGLAVVTEEFVLVLFGPQWAPAIPVIRIFCLVGVIESVGSSVGWIYQTQGRTDWLFRWGLGAGAVVLLAVGAGVLIGSVLAVAAAYAVAILLLLYPAFAIPGKLIDMRPVEVVRSVAGPVACTVGMAAVTWAVGLLVPETADGAVLLGARVLTGAGVYAALLLLFRPAPFREVVRLVSSRRRPRAA